MVTFNGKGREGALNIKNEITQLLFVILNDYQSIFSTTTADFLT